MEVGFRRLLLVSCEVVGGGLSEILGKVWLLVNSGPRKRSALVFCLCTPAWFSSAGCRFLHVHPVCLTDETPA